MQHPPKYTVFYQAAGDLEKDNIPEKAVIYNTQDTNIENGGMMGDRIQEMEIESGILHILQAV